MLRRILAGFVAVGLFVTAAFAEEVKGQLVKFADGKLTIKSGDKESTFTVPADLKGKRKGKDGKETEYSVSEMLTKMSGPDSKFKPNLVLDVDKDTVKSLKFEFGKGPPKKTDKKDN